jgi:hypothetical protein
MATKTGKLLNQLNQLRGKVYPDKGFMFYADVRGDGMGRKGCYTIINGNGGVIANALNGIPARERCESIRSCIRLEGGEPIC